MTCTNCFGTGVDMFNKPCTNCDARPSETSTSTGAYPFLVAFGVIVCAALVFL